jgi:hypothetical protein
MNLPAWTLLIGAAFAAGWAGRYASSPNPPAAPGAKNSASRQATQAGTPALPLVTLEAVLAAPETKRLPMAAAYLAQTDAAGCAALAAGWKQPPAMKDHNAWRLLFMRWVQVDAPAALVTAEELEKSLPDNAGKDLRLAAFQAWGAVDAVAALAAARTPAESKAVLQGVLAMDAPLALRLSAEIPGGGGLQPGEIARALAAQDLDAARRWMNETAPPAPEGTFSAKAAKRRFEIAAAIARQMALTDPEGAIQWVLGAQLQNDSGPGKLWRELLAPLMNTDPARAAGIAGKLPASRDAADLVTACYRTWAAKDPAAAAASAKTLPPGRGRAFALSAAAIQLATSDLPAARALLDEIGWEHAAQLGQHERRGVGAAGSGMVMHSDSGPAFAFSAVLKELAAHSPLEAVGLLGRLSATAGAYWSSSSTTAEVISRATAQDPAGTARALQALPEGDYPDKAYETLASEWMKKDAAAARAWVDALTDGKIRQDVFEAAAKALGKTDPAAALDWVAAAAPDKLPKAFAECAADNPQAAAALLDRTAALLDASKAAGLIASVASAFGKVAPEQGIAWLNALPDTTDGAAAAGAFAEAWVDRDRVAASAWADKVEPGPQRDSVASKLVAGLVGSNADYPAAMAWAASIADSEQRRLAMKSVMEPWRQQSPAAAAAAVESTRLSQAEKATYHRDAK